MKIKNIPDNRYVIWIDQKKAVIGILQSNDKYSHEIVKSGIETRIRFSGEVSNKIRPTTSKRTKETSEKRKLDQEIIQFCNNVISKINNPLSILILGPANFKNILQKLLKSKQVYENVYIKTKVEDKLTLNEIKSAAFLYHKIDRTNK